MGRMRGCMRGLACISPWGSKSVALGGREEAFMSSLVHRIPGMAASERGYASFLNKLRTDVFDHVTTGWLSAGLNPDTNMKAFKDLAKYINHSTGRGDLGKFDRFAVELNALFFSPKFQMSRLQLGKDLVTSDPAVRKIIAADAAAFVGTGLLVLSLAKAGGADVELDPRATDFGKIRIGNSRVDFSGGILAACPVRCAGNDGRTRERRAYQWYRQNGGRCELPEKQSVPGCWPDVGLLAGQTMVGERIEPSLGEVPEQVWNTMAPIFLQDLQAAIQFQGLDASTPLIGTAAFFGAGVSTYPQMQAINRFG